MTTAKITDSNVTTAKIADANVTAVKLADAAKLGLNDGTSVRRGKSIIATEESTTSTSYTTLTTPDQVASVVLPTDGLIFILAEATFFSSVSGGGNAALFIGSTQLSAYSQNVVTDQYVATVGTANTRILSAPVGLVGVTSSAYAPPTTGQTFWDGSIGAGGICAVFAAAGTYDISIKYKATSGTVSAKNRKLWVWTQSF